ncbi:hypothetical protein HaLaN_03272, partial [Haematococcus lacustris]
MAVHSLSSEDELYSYVRSYEELAISHLSALILNFVMLLQLLSGMHKVTYPSIAVLVLLAPTRAPPAPSGSIRWAPPQHDVALTLCLALGPALAGGVCGVSWDAAGDGSKAGALNL